MAFRAVEALRRPLQVDEALTLVAAQHPLAEGIRVFTADVHPPLILLMLRPLEAMHVPDIIPRLLMVACGLASVALLYGIVRIWSDRLTALFAMALAAIMPSIVFYDTWVRMYAPLSAAELSGWFILSLLVTNEVMNAPRRRMLWVLWAASSVASLYLQYLGWFNVLAEIAWIAVRHRGFLLKTLVAAVSTVLLWLPQLPTFLSQLGRGGKTWPWALQHPALATGQIAGEALLRPETGFSMDALHLIGLAWTLAAALAVLIYARNTVLPWLGVPAALTLAFTLLSKSSLFEDRYYLLLAYAVCAWSALALAQGWSWHRESRFVTIGALVLLVSFSGLRSFDPFYYTADWPAVFAFIRDHSNAQDVIVSEQSTPLLVAAHNGLLGRRVSIGVDSGDPEASIAARRIGAYRRAWVILFEVTAADPNEDFIRDLNSRFQVVRLERFNRASTAESVTVAELIRRP